MCMYSTHQQTVMLTPGPASVNIQKYEYMIANVQYIRKMGATPVGRSWLVVTNHEYLAVLCIRGRSTETRRETEWEVAYRTYYGSFPYTADSWLRYVW